MRVREDDGRAQPPRGRRLTAPVHARRPAARRAALRAGRPGRRSHAPALCRSPDHAASRTNELDRGGEGRRMRDRAEMAGAFEDHVPRTGNQRGTYSAVPSTGTTWSSAGSPVTTSVGALTRRQSAARPGTGSNRWPAPPSASEIGARGQACQLPPGKPPPVGAKREERPPFPLTKPPGRFRQEQRAEEPWPSRAYSWWRGRRSPARARRRRQHERRRSRGMNRGEARCHQAAERHAADDRAIDPALVECGQPPPRPPGARAGSRPPGELRAPSENVSTETSRQRVDRRPHVFPAVPECPGRGRARAPRPVRRLDSFCTVLVPQRLAGLQRVLNPLERLRFAAELEKRFALEVQQVLLGHRRLMRQRAAGEDRRERAADQGVVIADAARRATRGGRRASARRARPRRRRGWPSAAPAAGSLRARARARAPSRRPSGARGSS